MQFINGLYAIFACFIIVTSIFFVTVIPHKLRWLRISKFYNGFLLLCSILLIVGVALQFQDNFNCDERLIMFFPLYSITFLLLYKLCDYIALKKLKRHMYYLTMRGIYDEESINSTIIENIAQFAVIAISIYFPMTLSSWIAKIWYSC